MQLQQLQTETMTKSRQIPQEATDRPALRQAAGGRSAAARPMLHTVIPLLACVQCDWCSDCGVQKGAVQGVGAVGDTLPRGPGSVDPRQCTQLCSKRLLCRTRCTCWQLAAKSCHQVLRRVVCSGTLATLAAAGLQLCPWLRCIETEVSGRSYTSVRSLCSLAGRAPA